MPKSATASPVSVPDPEPEEEVGEPPSVAFDAPPTVVEEEAPVPATPDPDADGFGTFNDGDAPVEAAAASVSAPWTPVAPAFPEDTDGGWGTSAESAWGAAAAEKEEQEAEVEEEDEWARAARAKAALDRALVRRLNIPLHFICGGLTICFEVAARTACFNHAASPRARRCRLAR